jgi:hypothetical protein
MADKNLSIVFIAELDADEELPEELEDYTGDIKDLDDYDKGFTFYFPAVRVERGLEKDLKILSMSSQTRAIDIKRVTDTIRLMGYWRDDTAGDYDGLTSIQRVNNLYTLNTLVEMYGKISWSSGESDSELLVVMAYDFNCDQTPGEGDLIQYNFLFAVVDETLSTQDDDEEEDE